MSDRWQPVGSLVERVLREFEKEMQATQEEKERKLQEDWIQFLKDELGPRS